MLFICFLFEDAHGMFLEEKKIKNKIVIKTTLFVNIVKFKNIVKSIFIDDF